MLAHALSVPLAAAALILLSPLFVLVAIAIKLESRGPLFFVQERVGLKGKRFKIVKFRTMRPARGATSEWERDNQIRLTRVGRCLRRIRLDELPQLLNIVKGEMSLVGPRPHPVTNAPLFSMVMRNAPDCGAQIPYYELRAMVRPGLTGWAQVRYHYANDLEEEIEKMRYDLYYVKHRSALLDLRILVETIRVVLRGPDIGQADAAADRRVPAPVPRPMAPALRLAPPSSHSDTSPPLPRGIVGAAPAPPLRPVLRAGDES
jgi:lipopolysaccharide/colanic/teichoic acid biosynthesis glycosyltransferase